MSDLITAATAAVKTPAGLISAVGLAAPVWWAWAADVLPVVGQVVMFLLGLVIAILTVWNKILEIREKRRK